MTNSSRMKSLPDISGLVRKIEGIDTDLLRLEGEKERLSNEKTLAAQRILEKYRRASIPYKKCNHPREIEVYNSLDSSTRCGYCLTKLD